MSDAPSEATVDKKHGQLAVVIYVLYLGSILIPLLIPIGLVMAYVLRDDNPKWVESHYHFQAFGGWMYIGLLAVVVFLTFTGGANESDAFILAVLLSLAGTLWWIIRNARGLALAAKGKAISDPTAMIGGSAS